MRYCSNGGEGGGGDTEIREESAQKGDPGEENFPTLPAGTWTRDFLIRSLVLYHWAVPAPTAFSVTSYIAFFYFIFYTDSLQC